MIDRLQHALIYSASKNRDRYKKSKFVYVFGCLDYIKIGIALNPEKRLGAMQTGCPLELKILAKYHCFNAVLEERKLHSLLVNYRIRGEWFKIPDSLIAMLVKAQTIDELFNDHPSYGGKK